MEKQKKLFQIRLGDFGGDKYVGTYKTDGGLVILTLEYYWSEHKHLLKKKTFWNDAVYGSGWSVLKQEKIISHFQIFNILPITQKQIDDDEVVW